MFTFNKKPKSTEMDEYNRLLAIAEAKIDEIFENLNQNVARDEAELTERYSIQPDDFRANTFRLLYNFREPVWPETQFSYMINGVTRKTTNDVDGFKVYLKYLDDFQYPTRPKAAVLVSGVSYQSCLDEMKRHLMVVPENWDFSFDKDGNPIG